MDSSYLTIKDKVVDHMSKEGGASIKDRPSLLILRNIVLSVLKLEITI
ncbi:hypothetical protein UT300012_30240 [Paraclostridium bifermentans]|nr:hypothetical protein [Paraclostridium bifermentans]MBU5289469.1 hypothetical protein [Paraclostridium bifermentans]MDU7904155.1 hypothetical protein [Peptostreptococcaceae bacterium]